MTDDLKERLLTWHPGQDEEALREEAVARITELEARLAVAEVDVNRLREGEARLSLLLNETARARDAAEAGEDALAKAGRKAVVQLIDHGSDGYASGLDAALAAYEARRNGR